MIHPNRAGRILFAGLCGLMGLLVGYLYLLEQADRRLREQRMRMLAEDVTHLNVFRGMAEFRLHELEANKVDKPPADVADQAEGDGESLD